MKPSRPFRTTETMPATAESRGVVSTGGQGRTFSPFRHGRIGFTAFALSVRWGRADRNRHGRAGSMTICKKASPDARTGPV